MSKVIATIGPRGYKPKYALLEDGSRVELYEGPLIKIQNYNYDYIINDDFVNINKTDLPDYLSAVDSYYGSTDGEREIWLKNQIKKLQAVAILYYDKVTDFRKDDPDLAAITANIVIIGGKALVRANPVVGGVVASFGMIISLLHKAKASEVQEYKAKKIIEWLIVIDELQSEYDRLLLELTLLQYKIVAKSVMPFLIIILIVKTK